MKILQFIRGFFYGFIARRHFDQCTKCYAWSAKGRDLIFISWIKRDGTGTEDISKKDMRYFDNTKFEVHGLSLTYGTYIACGFNSYVVRIRKFEEEKEQDKLEANK